LVSEKLINALALFLVGLRNADGADAGSPKSPVANYARSGIVKKNMADERRSARANVLLVGAIESDGVRNKVRVSNLSAHGALIAGDMVMSEGTPVNFRCNGLTIQSCVAWIRAPYAGIDFDEPIQPDDLLRNSPVPPQVITRDTRELNFRRPGFRGNQLTDEERKIVEERTRPRQRPGDE
jgi:hypothetical protein